MAKLNQIIAVEKSRKAQASRELTDIYHAVQKPAPFAGIARTYRPKNEDGDQLPSESTRVQNNSETMLKAAAAGLAPLVNLIFAKDEANTRARGDVIVGSLALRDIPVSTLLYMEKMLGDVRTLINSLPTLDPAEQWHRDDAQGVWATQTTSTARTKKVPRNHIKAPATDKHAAQVELWYEDIVVGYWDTVKYSGAISQTRAAELRDRVDALLAAVKFARTAANETPVSDREIATEIFDYLFA